MADLNLDPFWFFVITLFGSNLHSFPSMLCLQCPLNLSCAIFRNNYTGGDNQLNRRMLSLPFIMPLTNLRLASSVVEGAQILLVVIIISMLSLGDLFPYWIMFTNFFASQLLIRFFTKLVYPSILLYGGPNLAERRSGGPLVAVDHLFRDRPVNIKLLYSESSVPLTTLSLIYTSLILGILVPTMAVHFNIIGTHVQWRNITRPGTFMRMRKYFGRNTYASGYIPRERIRKRISFSRTFSRRNKSAMTPVFTLFFGVN